jgi:hypothetical protein
MRLVCLHTCQPSVRIPCGIVHAIVAHGYTACLRDRVSYGSLDGQPDGLAALLKRPSCETPRKLRVSELVRCNLAQDGNDFSVLRERQLLRRKRRAQSLACASFLRRQFGQGDERRSPERVVNVQPAYVTGD